MNLNAAASKAMAIIESARLNSRAVWNPSTKAVTKEQQLDRARMINKTLGTRAAARYMRKNGWSLEAAIFWLIEKEVA